MFCAECAEVSEGRRHRKLPLSNEPFQGWEDGWRVVTVFGDAGVSDPPGAFMEFGRHRLRSHKPESCR